MHATKECTQFLKIFQNTPYSKNCPNTLWLIFGYHLVGSEVINKSRL
jgi:hypothetical protein